VNFTAIIENTDASIYSLNRDLRYITFNTRLHTVLSQTYGLDIKPGDKAFDFLEKLDPQEAKEWNDVYCRALDGETVLFEKEYHFADFYSCINFSIYPIWEKKTVIGLSCFAFDVSEQKKKEEAEKINLKIAADKLEKSEKFNKGVLASTPVLNTQQSNYLI
jgi:hypothetical protein